MPSARWSLAPGWCWPWPPLMGSVETLLWFFTYHLTLVPVGILAPIFLLLGCLIPPGGRTGRPPGPPWWSGRAQRTKAPHPPHLDRIFLFTAPPILRDWGAVACSGSLPGKVQRLHEKPGVEC